jgi:hypothetical protein
VVPGGPPGGRNRERIYHVRGNALMYPAG